MFESRNEPKKFQMFAEEAGIQRVPTLHNVFGTEIFFQIFPQPKKSLPPFSAEVTVLRASMAIFTFFGTTRLTEVRAIMRNFSREIRTFFTIFGCEVFFEGNIFPTVI